MRGNGLRSETLQWLSLSQLQSIEKLDLSANRLSKLPYDSLRTAKALVSLRANVNEKVFTAPPAPSGDAAASDGDDAANLWPSLVYLDLSNSSIESLAPGSFAYLSSRLSRLSLANSGVGSVDAEAFISLNNLISVNNLTYSALF